MSRRARTARLSGCRSTCCIRRRRCGSTRPRSCAPGRRPRRGRHERPAGADPSPPGVVYGGDEAVGSLPRHRAAARGSGPGDPAAGRSSGHGRLSLPTLCPQLGLLRQPLPDLQPRAGDAGKGTERGGFEPPVPLARPSLCQVFACGGYCRGSQPTFQTPLTFSTRQSSPGSVTTTEYLSPSGGVVSVL